MADFFLLKRIVRLQTTERFGNKRPNKSSTNDRKLK